MQILMQPAFSSKLNKDQLIHKDYLDRNPLQDGRAGLGRRAATYTRPPPARLMTATEAQGKAGLAPTRYKRQHWLPHVNTTPCGQLSQPSPAQL